MWTLYVHGSPENDREIHAREPRGGGGSGVRTPSPSIPLPIPAADAAAPKSRIAGSKSFAPAGSDPKWPPRSEGPSPWSLPPPAAPRAIYPYNKPIIACPIFSPFEARRSSEKGGTRLESDGNRFHTISGNHEERVEYDAQSQHV